MTKKEKRERKKQDRGIVDFMMVSNHFFHHLREWLLEMDDPRHPSYITYTQADLGYMAILKNICGQYTMREMDENFNQENCINTLRLMSGNKRLEEMPHYDTLNYYLEKLSPECLSELRKKMVVSLIRGSNLTETDCWGNIGVLFWMEQDCSISKKSIVRTVFVQRRKPLMERQSRCITIRFLRQNLC